MIRFMHRFKIGRISLLSFGSLIVLIGLLLAACGDDGSESKTEPTNVDSSSAAQSTVESTAAPTPTATQEVTAPADDVPGVEDNPIRQVHLQVGGREVEISALWGTQDFFQEMMPSAIDRWKPDQGFVFLVTYSVHEGEMPDDLPLPTLLLADEEFEISDEQEQQPHEHHRTRIVRFPVSSTEAVKPVLKIAEATLDWGEPEEIDYGKAAEDIKVATVHHVSVSDGGFSPSSIEMDVGEPVILVFDNRNGADEHHFHALGIEPETLFWLRRTGEMSPDELGSLRGASPLPFHLCSSDSLCPTGEDIHTHAAPGNWDAIFFIPDRPGEYEVSDPLHPEITGVIHIVEQM